MAADSPHKQEFRIRDLSTRSVLLFPTRAQIIRDIKEITLHPGANQIVIDGLAPTVDEHSIKVEGTGAATITEVTVDLLPNREVYEDIYPSDSEDSDEDDDEDDDEEEVPAMKAVVENIKQLNVKLLNRQEVINSAAKRLMICDNFGKSVAENRPPIDEMESLVKAYQVEREKIYSEHESATAAVDAIVLEIAKAEKLKLKVAKEIVKANEKKEKEKAKAQEKKARRKAEIFKEKQRIKTERESFWPKKVYRVTINLEPTTLTPGSSRRSSIDGDTIVNLATSDFHEPSSTPLKNGEINLSLSYITYSASWAPRYDLSLNSVKCTGVLEYGAELKNTTSETWKDAKIILSTSQTSFSGLSESIPILQPWHVRLLKGAGGGERGLFSDSELQAKHNEWNNTTGGQAQKPRWEIFGKDNSSRDAYTVERDEILVAKKKKRQANIQQVAWNNSHMPQQPVSTLGFGSAAPGGGSFGATPHQQEMTRGGGRFGSSIASASLAARRSMPPPTNRFLREEDEEEKEESDENAGFGLFDDGEPHPKSLTFEEGAWEESGMTTTYEVPAAKTLAPSNSTTKHKIAKIDFKSIIFSHIIIGKLRQVAFLKARLRNTSKITLLKGPLGLTLDGSFLGQTTFPRCSSGESFSLPLGVDPAINITYTKPTVRRSQTGIFNKEDTNVFTRTVTINNTKHNAAAELTVLDQVPVSEDERLKIEIVTPKGLKVGGEGVRSGQSATANAAQGTISKGTAKDVRASMYGSGSGGESTTKWGSAVATTKKGGEVVWNVKLNPGQGVKLVLEYEALFPAGEAVAVLATAIIADLGHGNVAIDLDIRKLLTAAGSADSLSQLVEEILFTKITEADREQKHSIPKNSLLVKSIAALGDAELKLTVGVDGKAGINVEKEYCFDFPTLPVEIRLQIWNAAMPGPRIVDIGLHEQSESDSDDETVHGDKDKRSSERFKGVLKRPERKCYYWRSSTPTPNPITLFINCESRKETFRRFKIMFGSYTGLKLEPMNPKIAQAKTESISEEEVLRMINQILTGNQSSKPRYGNTIYMDPVNDVPYFSRYSTSNPSSKSDLFSALADYLSLHMIYRCSQGNLINTVAISAPTCTSASETLNLWLAIFYAQSVKKVILVMKSPDDGQANTSQKPYRYLSLIDATKEYAACWERRRKLVEEKFQRYVGWLRSANEEASRNGNVGHGGDRPRRRLLVVEAKAVVNSGP